jgi:hypothetical protein
MAVFFESIEEQQLVVATFEVFDVPRVEVVPPVSGPALSIVMVNVFRSFRAPTGKPLEAMFPNDA